MDGIVKSPYAVIPAEAGIQSFLIVMYSRLRGDDKTTPRTTFYEFISFS